MTNLHKCPWLWHHSDIGDIGNHLAQKSGTTSETMSNDLSRFDKLFDFSFRYSFQVKFNSHLFMRLLTLLSCVEEILSLVLDPQSPSPFCETTRLERAAAAGVRWSWPWTWTGGIWCPGNYNYIYFSVPCIPPYSEILVAQTNWFFRGRGKLWLKVKALFPWEES